MAGYVQTVLVLKLEEDQERRSGRLGILPQLIESSSCEVLRFTWVLAVVSFLINYRASSSCCYCRYFSRIAMPQNNPVAKSVFLATLANNRYIEKNLTPVTSCPLVVF